MDYNNDFSGLIFDCDGTLIDTMPMHYTAWSEVLLRNGIHFTLERFYALGGVPVHNIIELLAKEQNVVVDVNALAWEKEERFMELTASRIEPIEKVAAIARRAAGLLPMAVATGSPTWLTEKMLKSAGLDNLFETIIGADKVQKHKPDPETYLTAASALGLDPTTCCAFEDTNLGIESAQSAGMTIIDIRLLQQPV
jgi:beta-phosphoglucomutase-like phosphatase (HAD superfamily)